MSCNTTMTAAQMVEERNRLWKEAKTILDQADAEKRSLRAEEREKYDQIERDIDEYAGHIATSERKERMARINTEMQQSAGRRTDPAQPHQARQGDTAEAVRSWLARPANRGLSADEARNAQDCGVNPDGRQFSIRLKKPRNEQRALSVGSSSAGGTLANWPNFADLLQKSLLAYGNAVSLVRVLTTANGIAIPVPTVDDTSNKAVIVAEAGSIATNADPTTGSVTLNAYKYSSKAIQVSIELVQDSMIDLEELLPELIGERFGRAFNQHITVGTGSSQPNGIFPRATASGTVVGGTVASPTFSGDNFIDLMHSVDPAYRNSPRAGFMMHDTIVQRARKLKDNNGQYLWQPSLQMGQPDRLLGFPLNVNQDAPTLAVNAKIAAFGDYSKYYWRQVGQLDFYRLDELYIINGQLAFMGLWRADGNLINVNAVKTLAAPAS